MNAQQSKIVEEVGMRCADCKYWEAIGFCVESVVGTFITASVTDGVRM